MAGSEAASRDAGGSAGASQSGLRQVLTWVPPLGSTVDRDQPLFRVNDVATYLLFGTVPAYRQLDGGSSAGPDISQLQQNLVDMGFGTGVSVSGTYDLATYGAVARWEASVGLDGDGVVQIGEIAFAPSASLITGEPLVVGSNLQSGATIVYASSLEKVVFVPVDARRVGDLSINQPSEATLPDGAVVHGKVSAISTAATATGGTAANASDPVPSSVQVTVSFDDAVATSLPADAAVHVRIILDQRTGVLAVPAGALVSGVGGQTSLSLAGSPDPIPVKTGASQDAMVELVDAPAPISDGTEVLIPS